MKKFKAIPGKGTVASKYAESATIEAMGVLTPAHNVPIHPVYSPSITIRDFKSIIKSAVAANNSTLVDGMILQVIYDINSDNAAGNVPNNEIRNYYREYFNVVSKCSIATSNLVNQLKNLV